MEEALFEVAESLGAIAEAYDRLLVAMVEVSRQKGGEAAAERARIAIERGREIGRNDLQRLAEREMNLFMQRPYDP